MPETTTGQEAASLAAQYDHDSYPDGPDTYTAGPGEASPNPLPERGPDGKFVKAQPQRNQRLVRLAAELGFTQDDIDASTDADLKEAVDLELRAQSLRSAKDRVQPATSDAPTSEPEPPAAPVDHGLTEENCTPEILAAFKRLTQELAQTRTDLAQVRSLAVGQAQMTAAQQADAFFAQDAKLFGTGSGQDLRGTPEFTRRMAVIREADTYKGMSPAAALAKAKAAIYPTSPAAPPERNGHAPPAEDFATGGTHRPTNRTPQPEKNPVKRAVTAAHRFMSENGMLDEETPDMPE